MRWIIDKIPSILQIWMNFVTAPEHPYPFLPPTHTRSTEQTTGRIQPPNAWVARGCQQHFVPPCRLSTTIMSRNIVPRSIKPLVTEHTLHYLRMQCSEPAPFSMRPSSVLETRKIVIIEGIAGQCFPTQYSDQLLFRTGFIPPSYSLYSTTVLLWVNWIPISWFRIKVVIADIYSYGLDE